MSGGRGGRPSGEIREWNGDSIVEVIREAAEPRAKHDAHGWNQRRMGPNRRHEGVEMLSPIGRAHPRQWTIHGMHRITRASRGSRGPPELRPGGDERGPRASGARSKYRHRMPIASGRAANPGTDGEANRDRVMKRPKRPVRNVVPLMQSRFPRHLTAPSGKTKSTKRVRLEQRGYPRTARQSARSCPRTSQQLLITGGKTGRATRVNLRPRTSRCGEGGSLRSTEARSIGRSGSTRRARVRLAGRHRMRPTEAVPADPCRGH